MMNTVKVKFGAEPNHSHDGRAIKAGEVVELPEDLAAFVIGEKKATRVNETAAAVASVDPKKN